ncbi:TPA: nucleotidyl transferase AbiEii/AbiGii toxin family protein [Burkholderia multivorans]|uniref:nucleotidyl transferase AbiEii/AbiGii toxin family protein n=1 Tax=Burkholderia multivorans TaxID=87883 RepID=UPI0011B29651|nr:nucleotidyl transferase AbiEii/AbiGii toxin family protein [Burkholderia multivorans]MBU9301190.1 nucleotidyl transferase AbiEii/AbiGii toxin family protein [Burkholderia multivorans]MBU9305658.1 nucleotidyl transferase AbiEii/AbiGii toxin family protein [Burkholderia multivorans]MBU9408192.1 nucleotidyl transferase AbiEii/AbiGii toxin family protein [Burkholderia multivorans]MBU9510409.1 nucleotidyl transferase AbiEii/AbiGii toxin family protein [Burkholderia multivorans]MCA8462491.1 nucle
MTATRKIFIALASVVIFDLIGFRSGLYASITTTESMQGFGIAMVRALEKLPPMPDSGVILTGDSRISEGFSARRANDIVGSKTLAVMNAGIPGSDIRDWYYFLQTIDPDKNRFRAIVLTLPTFRAAPPVVSRIDEPYHSDFLVPTIGSMHYLDFAMSQSGWRARFDAISQWGIDPLTYQADFGKLLADPLGRLANVRWKQKIGIHFGDDYDGNPMTMIGLSYDPSSGAITYPTRLNDEQRHKLDIDFKHPNLNLRVEFADWMSQWLSRIVNRYAGSATRVYIVRLPSTPLPAAVHDDRYPLAPFFMQEVTDSNIRIVPESLLLALEQPQYFFDNRHLNSAGRKAMTTMLAKYLDSDLGSECGQLKCASEIGAQRTAGQQVPGVTRPASGSM